MTRFAQGTDPEYIKKVNEAMYGAGKDNPQIKEDLLLEADSMVAAEDVVPNGDTNGTTTGTTNGKPIMAGLGNNKMIVYLVVGGIVLWYLNKEGYLKKILK